MPEMRPMLPKDVSVVIWTTTPWTLPGNRAISYSSKIASDRGSGYGLYEVTDAPPENWAKTGDKLILANKCAANVFKAARVSTWKKLDDVGPGILHDLTCEHPLARFNSGYRFTVPLLDGDHVTDEDGTGFVHTAPGHGREDFDIWTDYASKLREDGIDPTIPFTVDADG